MCITLKDIKQIIIDGLKPYANEIGLRARKKPCELYRRENMRTVKLSFLYEGGYVEKRICPCMFFDFHIIEDICTKNGVDLHGSVLTIELLRFEAYRKYGYSWELKKEMAIKRTDIFDIFDEEECLAALEKSRAFCRLPCITSTNLTIWMHSTGISTSCRYNGVRQPTIRGKA